MLTDKSLSKAKVLEEVGCSAIMPLGSPIGSGNGVLALEEIKIIIEQANIPVVVDAGLGVPSEASVVMENGADAVLDRIKSIKFANKLIKGQGRILVRRSGTEAKVRIMGESKNKVLLNKCIKTITKTIY